MTDYREDPEYAALARAWVGSGLKDDTIGLALADWVEEHGEAAEAARIRASVRLTRQTCEFAASLAPVFDRLADSFRAAGAAMAPAFARVAGVLSAAAPHPAEHQ